MHRQGWMKPGPPNSQNNRYQIEKAFYLTKYGLCFVNIPKLIMIDINYFVHIGAPLMALD